MLRKRQFRQRHRSPSNSDFSDADHHGSVKVRRVEGGGERGRKERKRKRRSRSFSSSSLSESSPERSRKVRGGEGV